jgi:hypothetical protein
MYLTQPLQHGVGTRIIFETLLRKTTSNIVKMSSPKSLNNYLMLNNIEGLIAMTWIQNTQKEKCLSAIICVDCKLSKRCVHGLSRSFNSS